MNARIWGETKKLMDEGLKKSPAILVIVSFTFRLIDPETDCIHFILDSFMNNLIL